MAAICYNESKKQSFGYIYANYFQLQLLNLFDFLDDRDWRERTSWYISGLNKLGQEIRKKKKGKWVVILPEGMIKSMKTNKDKRWR
jgi:hypothetical protein